MKLYFYEEDGDMCYPMSEIKEMMKVDEITERVVFLAKSLPSDGTFWCSYYGLHSQDGCGKECREYEPRNKISGCCRFRKNLYIPTEEKVVKI